MVTLSGRRVDRSAFSGHRELRRHRKGDRWTHAQYPAPSRDHDGADLLVERPALTMNIGDAVYCWISGASARRMRLQLPSQSSLR